MADPTETTLHRAMLADPEADEPRLELARWYEGRNDPRGKFIRLQIDAARKPYAPDRTKARNAANQLLDAHRASWSRGMPTYVTMSAFVRGFIEVIALDASTFLRDAQTLYALAPIRMLVLANAKPVIPELARDPNVARIVKLSLEHSGLTDDDVATLVQSPHVQRLKALELSFNQIGRAGVEALCATDRLPSLEYVNLAGNKVEDPVETFGEDWATGIIIPNSISLPELGSELEAKYGEQAWLHAPSRLRNYPPRYEDL